MAPSGNQRVLQWAGQDLGCHCCARYQPSQEWPQVPRDWCAWALHCKKEVKNGINNMWNLQKHLSVRCLHYHFCQWFRLDDGQGLSICLLFYSTCFVLPLFLVPGDNGSPSLSAPAWLLQLPFGMWAPTVGSQSQHWEWRGCRQSHLEKAEEGWGEVALPSGWFCLSTALHISFISANMKWVFHSIPFPACCQLLQTRWAQEIKL